MNSRTKERLLTGGAVLLICAVGVVLPGCAVTSGMRMEIEHTSHPFAGPPFGPRNEEDSLDTINIIKRVKRGRFYSEVGLGYKIGDGGFYGPPLTTTLRMGISLERAQ